MDIKITYPNVAKHKLKRNKWLKYARWIFITAAVTCPVLNLLIGGKAWSVIVLMSLYMTWKLLISPDLVEYNRISQFIKVITYSCVMMILIEVFLVSGWAVNVVPMVTFSGLIGSGMLFFTDLERQKQNMSPMLLLIFLSLVGSAVGQSVWHDQRWWPYAVMGAIAVFLVVASFVVLGSDFVREFKRRFHIK